MSHYSCKKCGLRYDDCICSFPPVKREEYPDDGKHWKAGGMVRGMQGCINCGKTYYDHVLNPDAACPTPPGLSRLSDERIRDLVRLYWGKPTTMEPAHMAFARLIEKEVLGDNGG
jgi:hypothetical protein